MTITLATIIGRIESANNPTAVRFEPGVYARPVFVPEIIRAIALANKCTQATAKVIYSMSWGEFQMMGFNLYDPVYNYAGSVGDFMASKIDQANVFNRFVIRKGINYTPDELASSIASRKKFALTYNGAPDYADRIEASLRANGFGIK